MDTVIEEAHRLALEAQRVAGLPALYARFLDNAAEAVVIVDQHGLIAFFNRKATFLFGYPPEEVIGKPVEVLLPESKREQHANVHRAGFMADPYSRAMGANLDLKARHKDGSEFPVIIDLHPEMGSDGTYVRAAIRRKEQGVTVAQHPNYRNVDEQSQKEPSATIESESDLNLIRGKSGHGDR